VFSSNIAITLHRPYEGGGVEREEQGPSRTHLYRRRFHKGELSSDRAALLQMLTNEQ
jgi:hypothetical protein